MPADIQARTDRTMIVQIYETQNPREAANLVAAGIHHVGVLVGNGEFPREIPPEQAREILAAVTPPARRVALTLSSDLDEIRRILRITDPDIVHLGMPPQPVTPDSLHALKREFPHVGLMRTIPVTGDSAVEMAREYDGIADYLLLDTHIDNAPVIGATGRTHDWSISRRIVEAVSIPVILAGGLGPENVAEAVAHVQPWGVDSKTGTDRDDGSHCKDPDRVARFARNATALPLS